ncbi:hypothetical protein [Asticcacaulis sp. 201]|uniref:hypothetical protein n=1 Tax=Asticcacaulis sp. 201 TaxID=3028787 RepID=UPI0029166476|nr:hypothetical protein [Asticcacaulis sp. 201]MDV6330406.1 hypothetical protein [Asticcacaulis sp. 201]
MKKLTLVLTLFVVGGCASTPQTMLSTLDRADPKYESQGCIDARNIAMQYDNKPLTRGALEAISMALGPLATGGYSLLDSNTHVRNRDEVMAEIHRRCTSGSADLKKCHEENGKIICV